MVRGEKTGPFSFLLLQNTLFEALKCRWQQIKVASCSATRHSAVSRGLVKHRRRWGVARVGQVSGKDSRREKHCKGSFVLR